MLSRVCNFDAGPAMLPLEVLQEVQEEFLNWQCSGMSILELGHRSSKFIELITSTESLLRELLIIPNEYKVLFLSGTARMQFAMLPLNFLPKEGQAGYFVTGLWSLQAKEEALRVGNAYIIADGRALSFTSIPSEDSWVIKDNTKYIYLTPNETANGIYFDVIPNLGIPLIADMTSCLLTEAINIAAYDLIFAGVQKNIGNFK